LGGSLKFTSELTSVESIANSGDVTLAPGNARPGIAVGDGVELNVNGRWTNDGILAGGLGTSPTLQNGGIISVQLTQPGSELVLGNAVTLSADGGAWVQASGSITGGTGGAITVDASPAASALQFGQNLAIQAFGVETAAGGKFALSAPRINISQGNGSDWTVAQRVDDLTDPVPEALTLYAPLFASNGFSSVALTATGAVQGPTGMQPYSSTDDALTVDAGTTITALTRTLQLNPGYQTLVSGGDVSGFTQASTLPLYSRPVTNVSLNLLRGSDDTILGATKYGAIDLQAGAAIVGDPGAAISITGEGSIFLAGTLRAPGGSITVQTISPGTGSTFDPGYLPDQGITVAGTGVIDVSGGSAVLTPNNQGLLLGSVRSGGTVELSAQRGALTLDEGSRIDISGSSATLDLANPGSFGYTREVVATPGGSLTLASVESIDLSGTISGHAGVGSSGTPAGGSLTVDLTRSEPIAGQPDPYGLPMQIDVVGDSTGGAAAGRVNLTTLGVAQIEASGIDSLTLNAGGQTPGSIIIDTASPLSLARQLTLESQSIAVAGGFAASLAAPSVTLENLATQGSAATSIAPVYGSGTLGVAAQQIVVAGNVTLQNVAAATLTSQGDVQLEGTASATGHETGTLVTAGNLTIDAARIYPDTFTSFAIAADSLGNPASGTVTLGQTTVSPGVPLSAGGAVSIAADTIMVGGSLYAPFGRIALTANNALTIADGGLVSVSGAGLDVPYGVTQDNAAQWVYQTPLGPVTVTGVPLKQVALTAPAITVAGKATVDLTGGGDLYAYEWVPGTGGSTDALSSSTATGGVAGLYALLPTQRGLAAPYDPQESGPAGSTYQTVYLTGGAGLAAGYYALLPPRYALQPGALLVKIEPTFVSPTPGQIGALPDGTPVLAGYLTSGTTGLYTGATEYQGFAIYPGSYGQQLAAYTVSPASTFFSGLAKLAGTAPVAEPADAGSLTFSVVQALSKAVCSRRRPAAAAGRSSTSALPISKSPRVQSLRARSPPAPPERAPAVRLRSPCPGACCRAGMRVRSPWAAAWFPKCRP
jgi:hypothetical protein